MSGYGQEPSYVAAALLLVAAVAALSIGVVFDALDLASIYLALVLAAGAVVTAVLARHRRRDERHRRRA